MCFKRDYIYCFSSFLEKPLLRNEAVGGDLILRSRRRNQQIRLRLHGSQKEIFFYIKKYPTIILNNFYHIGALNIIAVLRIQDFGDSDP